jgi:hypothetical protein
MIIHHLNHNTLDFNSIFNQNCPSHFTFFTTFFPVEAFAEQVSQYNFSNQPFCSVSKTTHKYTNKTHTHTDI